MKKKTQALSALFLRRMTTADIEECYAIECDQTGQLWSKESFFGELETALSEGYVLVREDAIIGFYFAWHTHGESSLNNIVVKRKERGCGYGRLLLTHFLQRSRLHGSEDLFLEVSVHNFAALALYASVGFRKVALRKNYYSLTHEDAYVMKKEQTFATRPLRVAHELWETREQRAIGKERLCTN
uniref:ribosomal protein S18-alanine N-acetyltransferase n=1 Tax=Ndongobacter massiliensis TaxID=1871025 RepID=UPI000930AAD1|nr:ribosomal protein S18-alanine N-acetyltransferase [Ndongobacter massiliensis]